MTRPFLDTLGYVLAVVIVVGAIAGTLWDAVVNIGRRHP